ncbi:MAG: tail fiber domain-containing protein, partial [Bacteroidota bacterium]
VSYHYNRQKDGENKVLGFIAQEVQPLFPELVVESEDGSLGMSYSHLGVVAIQAAQEQQEVIDQQQTQIDALKDQIKAMQKQLQAIQSASHK